MAAVGFGFSGMKLERRRPSKRETTSRTFAIVRNWKSNTETSSAAGAAKVHQSPEKVISSHLEVPLSPQYARQPWHSKQDTESITDLDSEKLLNTPNHATEYDTVPESPIYKIRSDSHTVTVPGLPSSLSPQAVDNSTNMSINVDHTLSTPHTDNSNASTTEHKARRVTRQRPPIQPSDKEDKPPKRETRNRKRKQEVTMACDETEQEAQHSDVYAENRFVRIYNADQGRKVSVKEITDLDVVLTAIEEEALQYRDEVKSEVQRQCIKDFFIQARKSFGESIDLHKEHRGIKSDLRKAKIQLNKYKTDLLEVQKKRTRLKARLEKMQKDKTENNQNDKDLQEINNFVHQMKTIQKRCPKRTHDKTQDYSTIHSLPSLMCQVQALLISMTRLQSVNTALERWLNSN